MKTPNRGVALINVLIVVAVIAGISVKVLQRAEHGRNQIARNFQADETALAIDGALDETKVILANLPVDGPIHLRQAWARAHKGVRIGTATAAWQISDLQGRLNVNTLAEPDNDIMQAAFQELALANGLSPAVVNKFIEDMIATNDNADPVQEGGFIYAGQLQHLFPGSAVAFNRLLPLLAALPVETGMNANTISAKLWQVLLPELPRTDREKMVGYLRRHPVADGDELVDWARTELVEDAASMIEGLDLDGRSEWFEVNIEARLDNSLLGRSVVLKNVGKQKQANVVFSIARPD